MEDKIPDENILSWMKQTGIETEYNKVMETESKYKLSNLLPFIILGIIFVVGCIVSNYYYANNSDIGQYVTWAIIVAVVIGFLVYIRIKNK